MFAIHLRRLYRTCDLVIIRNLRNRRLEAKGPNPGVDKTIKAFESEGLRVNQENLEEFVSQSDTDFYDVGEAYNEHINETRMGKYELRQRIIKDKYFKENMPSLLTWSEKEQIRHLATSQPDEWTPERIAESFPVTVPVVKKLLKYPWKPASVERIARHDMSIMRNWKQLKEGSLDIPKELRDHFLKFSNRTIPPLDRKSIKIDVTQEEKLGEFERIVRRCAAEENSNQSSPNNEVKSIAMHEDIASAEETGEKVIKVSKKDAKVVTLDELATKIKKRLEGGNEVDMGDKIIIDTINTNKNIATHEDVRKVVEIINENTEVHSLAEYKKNDQDPKDVMNYPERIRIPKKAYKKNATYKVNDCYYDHDGRFLYRVLGLTN